MKTRVTLAMMLIAGIALVAATYIAASASVADTPLFTVRMEQAASKMSFLPTAVNGFTYITEKGYELTCSIEGNCSVNGYCMDANPLATGASCIETQCTTCDTYSGGNTCEYPTCPATCLATCPATCPATCLATCPATCPNTCWDTCDGFTCSTCIPQRTCFLTVCIDCN